MYSDPSPEESHRVWTDKPGFEAVKLSNFEGSGGKTVTVGLRYGNGSLCAALPARLTDLCGSEQ